MPTIEAIITARGAKTTVPDNEGAVDARILVDGVEVGEVTLLPDNSGLLSAWGDPSNWASSALLRWSDTVDWSDVAFADIVSQIEQAVRTANV